MGVVPARKLLSHKKLCRFRVSILVIRTLAVAFVIFMYIFVFKNANWNIKINTIVVNKTNKNSKGRLSLLENKISIQTANTLYNSVTSELQQPASVKTRRDEICYEYPNSCTLHCLYCRFSSIHNKISSFEPKCSNSNLSLILTKCAFPSDILQLSFFPNSSIVIELLSINECELRSISKNAFQHQNVKNLHTLLLIGNRLLTLEADTFSGLTNIMLFEFVQNPTNNGFKGNKFLKHFAGSLREAVIQPHINGSEISDPRNWWCDLEMNSVTSLDLSNTNLRGVLNSLTFKGFSTLGALRLYNCNLSSINAEVFEFITNNFQYLDLQCNHLKTLDGAFLRKMATTGMIMSLDLNEWFCDCKGEMLQYIANKTDSYRKALICSTPNEFNGKTFKQAIDECNAISTTTYITLTSISSTKYLATTTSLWIAATTTAQAPTTSEFNITTATSTELIPLSSITAVSAATTVPPETGGSIPIPSNLMPIECFTNDNRTKTVWTYILQPGANFTLNTISSTSLMITISATNILPHFVIIYFTNYESNSYITKLKKINYIEKLKPFTTYVVCLIVQPMLSISPFDCQSYFAADRVNTKTWLLAEDRTWFIWMTSIITILLFFASIFLTYKLLRRRPYSRFKPNQMWLDVNYSSGTESAAARNFSSEGQSHPLSRTSENSIGYLHSRPPPKEINETVAQTKIYCSQHMAPLTRAPHVPPHSEKFSRKAGNTLFSTADNCRTASDKKYQEIGDYLDVLENEPYYQTIDDYEEINN